LAPLDGPVTVQLRRAVGRAAGGRAADDASFYLGTVRVGEPAQELRVLFDTSSGNTLLPHRVCKSAACVEHSSYSPWGSSTAMDVNTDGGLVQAGRRFAYGRGVRDGIALVYSQSDLGEGDAKGVLVRDRVCVGAAGAPACVDTGIVAATSLADTPFRGMPNDGVVGLGLQPLAAGKIMNFLSRLFDGARNAKMQFGIALMGDVGELHLGGHHAPRFGGPVRWFPVEHPEQGYWQVAIRAVRVGNVTVDACRRGCHGVVDTGASRLGVQASHLPLLAAKLKPKRSPAGSCVGPDLSLDLGGMSLVLPAEEYADEDCARPRLGSLDLPEPEFVGVYALGAAVLRRYYAAFDWEFQRVGFAPLSRQAAGDDDDLPIVVF